jgi:broad specificity phosphatase PhoE
VKECTELLVVRHGDYNGGDMHLNSSGRDQIKRLAEKIIPIVNNKKVTILSSTASWAHESAAIIAEKIGCDFEQCEILWSDNRHPENFPGTLELIQSYLDNTDVLIIVTHCEYAEYFPSYFAKEQLKVDIDSYLIDKGNMWFLSWAEGAILTEVTCY